MTADAPPVSDARERIPLVYRVLRWFLRVVTRVFFRQVEIVGLEHIPRTGPVVFAGNHPNSLIDPILIITTCGRKVHFAAKDKLFEGRVLRAVLRGLGAVPIKRRHDHDGDHDGAAAAPPTTEAAAPVDNDAAFEAMFDVLRDGGTIGIFPEGLSHDLSQLAKLKTGAARLAIGGAKRSGPITIVPCGLTFIHPKRFRTRVLVQFGTPIVVDAAQDDVRKLTADLDGAMRRLTINAPDWNTVRALDAVRRLYQPQEISIEDRVELARRFNTHYAAIAQEPRVRETMTRVRAYQDKLDELEITDRELARDLSKLEVSTRVLRQILLVAIWLPLTLPGAPLHVPTFAFARFAGARLTPRKDVIATTKLLIGMLLVLVSYGVAITLLGWRGGWRWALGAALILPMSGWATLRVLDRLRLARRGFGVLARRLRFRTEVAALRREREALATLVIRVVGEVMPRDLAALFPADHPDRTAEESWRTTEEVDLDHELDAK
ncbi:MAG: 1-acyl-sn-glycerol-3-phosphate acyltransferase [Proteobacteria bacterium]|nr:1-acyl-sn-glycerol-3-phosphate acyltransferase [Pseudomonadota bacterium]